MKKERKGIDKSKIVESAKKNEELKKFVSELTKEDIELIKNRQKFGTANPGSMSYQIALYNDSIRSQIRAIKSKLENSMWQIDHWLGSMNDCKFQLENGVITIESNIKKGQHMTAYELKSYIWQKDLMIHGEIAALPIKLGQLRSLCDFKDVSMKVVMSVEEFDEYITKIKKGVEKYGYKLFKEVF